MMNSSINYLEDTEMVAQQLIGCIVVTTNEAGERRSIRVTETEAYLPENDPACHASVRKTKRNAVMFDSGGILYVYLIYGIHHCANIVTEAEGRGCAVLLRSGEILDDNADPHAATGPGKLAKYMNWSIADNGRTIAHNDIVITEDEHTQSYRNSIIVTPRIGITKAADMMLRYYAGISKAVTKSKFNKSG